MAASLTPLQLSQLMSGQAEIGVKFTARVKEIDSSGEPLKGEATKGIQRVS